MIVADRRVRIQAPPAAVALRLRAGAAMSLKAGRHGIALTCREGRLWLTQKGDPADHLLAAGETFRATGAGLIVLQALDEATIEAVAEPKAREPRRSGGDTPSS